MISKRIGIVEEIIDKSESIDDIRVNINGNVQKAYNYPKMSGEVNVGDEVILLGEDNGIKNNADDMAEILDTINYEILCMIGRRVPRIYIKDGKMVNVRNYL